jgi:hypothetical protein
LKNNIKLNKNEIYKLAPELRQKFNEYEPPDPSRIDKLRQEMKEKKQRVGTL